MALKVSKDGDNSTDNKTYEVVDLNDQPAEEIQIETFEDVETSHQGNVEFNTKAQKTKVGFFDRIRKIFDQENKTLKVLETQADKIMELEPQMKVLSDEQLAAKTDEFRKKIENGSTLDDVLIEAFAVVREASRRVLGLHAFKVQLMGAIALHNGDIAEMKTGEGKTLTSIFPVYLNALTGKGTHVVTVNDYLAGRDAEDNGKVFNFLGLTVGLNKRELSAQQKRAVHACDITYTTNAELGFDYLRDNMVKSMDQKVLRPLNYALVDEVDSILIDEARTPLIISGGQVNTAKLYNQADAFAKSLVKTDDYEVDETSKAVTLTEHGVTRAEKYFKVGNLYDIENTAIVHRINQALKANYAMTRDVEYMVATEDGSHSLANASVLIIDQFTGRVMPGRAYSDGLHQAIEAKEGVPIKEETITLANITYQNFFRLFNKLAGMTGTAKTEEEEFRLIYNMRVVEIPTNVPVIREDANDLVFAKGSAKFNALCDEVERRHSYGQPILIGTVAVETSEKISKMLKSRGIRHNVLNAKNHSKEAEIISRAGVKGAVTIATNMAGRGTDIKLGEGVKELGGLAVLGSERHESRRIDNQLRGRSGRQGDPGFSRFYVSFDDELLARFASDKVKSMVALLGDEAIDNKTVSKSIEGAQKRVEGNNFDARKQVLQYDDVMRQQREIMYSERDRIMAEPDLGEIVKGMFKQAIEEEIKAHTSNDGKHDTVDVESVLKSVGSKYMLFSVLKTTNAEAVKQDPEKLAGVLSEVAFKGYRSRFREGLTPEQICEYERNVLLSVIDYSWVNHIDAMSKLRNGIYLRAYAQKDPLREYTEEAFYMFEQMTTSIATSICTSIRRMGLKVLDEDVEKKLGRRDITVEF
ncbi:preprotein translocase subunit SecA [Beduini massiliensis]|uniref:preprotein translocase subunit SecA n=1 Tax=Beduini massiliensis TaxID=1585974 RepID=UPI00059A9DC6|nr:preprotein translocase subunit SecA [Beduini massiliensis]